MCYIYKFLDIENELLYIGKTANSIENRVSQHFENGHLRKHQYNKVSKIFYSKCLNNNDMSIKERYLIATLNPVFNKKYNNEDSFNFVIDDFVWEEYNYVKKEVLKVKKERGLIEVRGNRVTNRHGYVSILHENVTPRFWTYKKYCEGYGEVKWEVKRINYFIIEGEVFIPFREIAIASNLIYRKHLINKYNIEKTKFVTLANASIDPNNSEHKKMFIEVSSALEGVTKELENRTMMIRNRKKLELSKDTLERFLSDISQRNLPISQNIKINIDNPKSIIYN